MSYFFGDYNEFCIFVQNLLVDKKKYRSPEVCLPLSLDFAKLGFLRSSQHITARTDTQKA